MTAVLHDKLFEEGLSGASTTTSSQSPERTRQIGCYYSAAVYAGSKVRRARVEALTLNGCLHRTIGFEKNVCCPGRADRCLGGVFRQFEYIFGVIDADPCCFSYVAGYGSCRLQLGETRSLNLCGYGFYRVLAVSEHAIHMS